MRPIHQIVCTPGMPALADRPLIGAADAARLARVFKVLANDTRLRLIHALARAGELCLGDLAATVGMRPQAVSNQVQRLADQGILASRREGNNVFYRVADPCVASLLDLGFCVTETSAGTPIPLETLTGQLTPR